MNDKIEPAPGYVEDTDGESTPSSRLPQVVVTGAGVVSLVGGGAMVVLNGTFQGLEVAIPLDDDDVEAVARMRQWRDEHVKRGLS